MSEEIDRILNMSDEDIMAEAKRDGVDVESVIKETKAIVLGAIIAADKTRIEAAHKQAFHNFLLRGLRGSRYSNKFKSKLIGRSE